MIKRESPSLIRLLLRKQSASYGNKKNKRERRKKSCSINGRAIFCGLVAAFCAAVCVDVSPKIIARRNYRILTPCLSHPSDRKWEMQYRKSESDGSHFPCLRITRDQFAYTLLVSSYVIQFFPWEEPHRRIHTARITGDPCILA